MCGIVGILNTRTIDLKQQLPRMVDILAHRGPDGRGFHYAPGVGLGHARLSIIDVSAGANQPLYNEDRTVCVIHNGEIYNYKELRGELINRGHRFRTDSDSEIIVHAYEEYGADCVCHFNGMWSFAIWDEPRRELLLSRDRLGIKQLYYAFPDGGFAFASEIKALRLAFPELNQIEPRQLYQFLMLSLSDHNEHTFFRDVRQLLPGENLRLDSRGQATRWRYWSIADVPPFEGSVEEAGERLHNLLHDAVHLQLRSDVPIGASLSGGLDSTTVVALASTQIPETLTTFSGLYPNDERYDESRYVHDMVRTFDLSVHEITPGTDRILEDLTRCMWHLEEPVTSQSIYTWWHISQQVGQRVTVLLTGHGGDEVHAGYFHHYRLFHTHLFERDFREDLHRVPDPLRQEWIAARQLNGTNYLPQILATADSPWAARLGRRWQAMLARKSPTTPAPGLRAVLNADFMAEAAGPAATSEEKIEGLDPLRRFMWRELRSAYLPSILRIEDRLAMAHSVESRVPLLDHRIVEFAYSLPPEYMIREGRTKSTLRTAMRGILPESVRMRADKMGFPTPVATWLRGDLGAEVASLLASPDARTGPLLNHDEVQRQIAMHRAGQVDLSKRIFMWLMCELWLRNAGAPAR